MNKIYTFLGILLFSVLFITVLPTTVFSQTTNTYDGFFTEYPNYDFFSESSDCDPTQKVCSENGYTYRSECTAQEEGVSYTTGPCDETTTTEECDPNQTVCSENNYEYDSECAAQDEGVNYTLGSCEDNNTTTSEGGGGCDPNQTVCSENNYEYDSECAAQEEGVSYTTGPCEDNGPYCLQIPGEDNIETGSRQEAESYQTDYPDSEITTGECPDKPYCVQIPGEENIETDSRETAESYQTDYPESEINEEKCPDGPYCVEIPGEKDIEAESREVAKSYQTDYPNSEITEGKCDRERYCVFIEKKPYCLLIPGEENIETDSRETAESYQTDYPDSEITEGKCSNGGPYCLEIPGQDNIETDSRQEAESYQTDYPNSEITQGECRDNCDPNQKVCSEYGYTYQSECTAQSEGVNYTVGPCDETNTTTSEERSGEECDSSQKVCSENGYTYSSECIAQKEGVEYSMGACEDQTTTNERTGKEFSDRDEAEEFADRIGGEVEEGMCEEEKCPKQKDVCGVDGKMYENICEIRSEGIGIDFTGKSCDQGENNGCQPIEKKLDKLINQKDSLKKDKRELGCGNNLWTAGGAGVISISCEKEKKPIQNKINSLNNQIKEVRSQLRGCNKQNKTPQNLFKGKDEGSLAK